MRHPPFNGCTMPGEHDCKATCRSMGRDWAGRLQACTKVNGHTGPHIGATGAVINPRRV